MLLDRYFSREIWGAFLGFGLVLGGLAWMVQILLLMKLIIKYGVEVSGFIGMSFYTFPMLVGIIMPFVAFIAVMFVYNKMIVHNEISVLMATGLSPFRIARPALKIGVAAMVIHFILNLFIVPASQDAFSRAQWNLRYGLGHMRLKEASFNKMMDDVVIYVEEISNKDMLGLTMRDARNGGEKIITAENGKLITTPSGMSIAMGQGGFQIREGGAVAIGTFDGADMDMEISEGEEGASTSARRATTPELFRMLGDFKDYTGRNRARLLTEAATRFLTPLMNMLFVLIAAVFLLKTNTLRRRASLSAAHASLFMILAEALFMYGSVSAQSISSLIYIGIGQIVMILGLLWYIRK